MINCILILSIIISCVNASSHNVISEQDNTTICNGLANVFTFSSQMRFCEPKGNNRTECILIEENVIDGKRGKLIFKKFSNASEDDVQIYYQSNNPTEIVIGKDLIERRKVNEDPKLNQLARIYNQNKRKIIGPTSVLIDALNSKNNQFSYGKDLEYRGMKAYSCYTTGVRIILKDPKWPTDLGNQILNLQFDSISGQKKEFHYFKFTINDKKESIWRTPSLGLSFPHPEKSLPRFVGTGMHEMSLETTSSKSKESKRIDLLYNSKERLIRIDDTRTNEKMIYNEPARSKYTIEDGICRWKLDKTRNNKPSQDILHLFQILDYIEDANEQTYNYIGEEIIRDTVCDVYEYREESTTGESTVRTIHVKQKTDSKQDDTTSYPLRVSQVTYKNKKFEIESEFVFNILNYQELHYDQYYREIFQTKHCHSDRRDNLYLTMLAESDDFTEDLISTNQHIEQLKEKVNKLIRDITGLSYLQIPELFLEFRPKEMKIEFILEDAIRPADYFEKFEEFWISTDDLDDKSYEGKEQECAKKTLGHKKYYGYTYCPARQECFLNDVENSFLKDEKVKRKSNEMDCVIKKKILENNEINVILIHNAELRLKSEIEGNKVKLNTGDLLNKEKEIVFNMTSIYRSFRFDNPKRSINRLPFVEFLTRKRIVEKKIRHSMTVRTAEECYVTCRENGCTYFNLCSNGQTYRCDLSKDQEIGDENVETNNECDVYEMKNLNLFIKYEGKRFTDEAFIKTATDLKGCASKCLNRKDKKCKSFVFCGKDSCELTDQHKEAQLTKIDDTANCTIYSINYLEDYHQTSLRPTNRREMVRSSTIEGCALDCSQSNTSFSFNFCPMRKNSENLGHCHCINKDDPIPDQHELSWECITMQKNLNSFFYLDTPAPKKEDQSPISETDNNGGLNFWQISEVLLVVFLVGVLIGIALFVANEKKSFVPNIPVSKQRPRFSLKVRFSRQPNEDDENYLIEL